jgi:hypothetical protein
MLSCLSLHCSQQLRYGIKGGKFQTPTLFPHLHDPEIKPKFVATKKVRPVGGPGRAPVK